MNKGTSKYFNTAVKMNEALLSLLEKKDFQFVTVKEICDKAGVNRSTFYLHYETIGDLLSETVEYIMRRFREKFSTVETLSVNDIKSSPSEKLIFITPEYLIPYLEFVKENKRIFSVAISQPNAIGANKIFEKIYSEYFYPIMKRFGADDVEIEYKIAFYMQGIFAVISKWIQGDCKDEISKMAELLNRCVFPKGEIPL